METTMQKNFKEKSIPLLVGMVVLGLTIQLGATTVVSTFWTVLITALFYGLWSLADVIREYESWKKSVDDDIKDLKTMINYQEPNKSENNIQNTVVNNYNSIPYNALEGSYASQHHEADNIN